MKPSNTTAVKLAESKSIKFDGSQLAGNTKPTETSYRLHSLTAQNNVTPTDALTPIYRLSNTLKPF